ncbi:MFS transporter [Kitasatospora sp. NPDC085879]|uniref:MFS transporter n=1 Tax=Kitasatospora sp. NPDC085879 TaxID=3154769 RepID=UPI003449E42F
MTARIVRGAGAALIAPGCLPILRHVFARTEERTSALAVWGGMSSLSLALGPVIGGLLVGISGWACAFWISVPVSTASLIVGMKVLPDFAERTGRLCSRGQLCWAAGIAAAIYALTEAPGPSP